MLESLEEKKELKNQNKRIIQNMKNYQKKN